MVGLAVGAGVAGGRKVVEGARKPLLGVLKVALAATGEVALPVLLRVFPTGKAGRAELGGPSEGREAFGRAVAMVDNDRGRPRQPARSVGS